MVWVLSNRAIAVIIVRVFPDHMNTRTIMSMMTPTMQVRRYSLFFMEPGKRFFILFSIDSLTAPVWRALPRLLKKGYK